MESTNARNEALRQWLQFDCHLQSVILQPMPGDASFRRYFRVQTATGSFVAMDAPPTQENCRPYVAVARALREMGLHAPEIIHAKVEQGFLLLTDFGDLTYLKILNAQNADSLYRSALNALVVLQHCRHVQEWSIPLFTRDIMWQEWAWHKEWFLEKLLGLSLSDQEETNLEHCFSHIVDSAVSQPQVFMHRDYHSANLMQLENNQVGLLDFQDAFIGPVTYDAVSLLRDCYIDWPKEQVKQWALHYWQQLQNAGVLQTVSAQEFLRWFDWMGIERHLKALFTYARKYIRDHQSHYLNHVPRALNYLEDTSGRYPELAALYDYLHRIVQPIAREKLACVQ